MAHTLEALEAICRQRGGRMTRQRRAVLAMLLASIGRPVSAYDLRDAPASRSTRRHHPGQRVSLPRLPGQEHGLVHRLETTKSFVACDHPEHAHAVQFLICRQCGTVVEAEDRRVVAATQKLGASLGFAVDRPTVELTGVCASCSAQVSNAAT